MTPHHPKWQMNEAPPSDFDSPNPVSFLSVAGSFDLRLSWSGPAETPPEQAKAWTELAMEILCEALSEWGVGGKTSSGYGRPEDLREPQQRARLFKFHGCAVKATADEATYQPCLVARQSQIHGWTTRQYNAAIVQRLIDFIATEPTLMMGLSAQDANISAIFAAAEARLAWPSPVLPTGSRLPMVSSVVNRPIWQPHASRRAFWHPTAATTKLHRRTRSSNAPLPRSERRNHPISVWSSSAKVDSSAARLRRLIAMLTTETPAEATPRLSTFLSWTRDHLAEREARLCAGDRGAVRGRAFVRRRLRSCLHAVEMVLKRETWRAS
jgi:hypothetical protein